ncbi:MAG: hypothetical protein ABSB15_20730 [Bryobacteraceae bacterium]
MGLCFALATFGAQNNFHLEHHQDSFGMRSHGVIEVVNGSSKFYPLPQSTWEDYVRLRPKDVAMNPLAATNNSYEREEVIGPYQIEGGKVWFGKSFYDGEGERGVGAFGYFDTETRRYRLFSPPEVAPYEVSAMLVEADSVWLGLDHQGEDISAFPGGLMRWDRSTEKVRLYPIEFVVTAMERRGDVLRLSTNGGYAELRGEVVERFSVRKTANGKTETMRIDKFPPPPSHHWQPPR